MTLLKFNSLVFLDIVNQSIMVRIPQTPSVKSFSTPIPISPIIKRSIPKQPRKIDISKIVVGSFKSIVDTRENFCSSIVRSLSFKYIIFFGWKIFLVCHNKSIYSLLIHFLSPHIIFYLVFCISLDKELYIYSPPLFPIE